MCCFGGAHADHSCSMVIDDMPTCSPAQIRTAPALAVDILDGAVFVGDNLFVKPSFSNIGNCNTSWQVVVNNNATGSLNTSGSVLNITTGDEAPAQVQVGGRDETAVSIRVLAYDDFRGPKVDNIIVKVRIHPGLRWGAGFLRGPCRKGASQLQPGCRGPTGCRCCSRLVARGPRRRPLSSRERG